MEEIIFPPACSTASASDLGIAERRCWAGSVPFSQTRMSFVVGATSQNRSYDREGVASSGQIVFGVLQHFNFENQTPISFHGSQNTVGVFASTDLDYNDYLFVTLSARNDWVSNLPT